MEILTVLLVLLVVARGLGQVAELCGQPSLVGELCAGILLGALAQWLPETFHWIHGLPDDPTFRALVDLGIFFLMLHAGLDLHPSEVRRATRGGLGVAVGGMLVPLVLGVALGLWVLPESDVLLAQALFLGVALAVTAVPVAVEVLRSLGQLHGPVGTTVVSAAVLDDVFSLLLLAVLTGVARTGGAPSLAELAALAGDIVLFFLCAGLLGGVLLPYVGKILERASMEQLMEKLEFSTLLAFGLALSLLAEHFGMHFLVGAFLAGLFFGRRTVDDAVFEEVETSVGALALGFLGPVFFVSIGLHLDLSAFSAVPGFTLVLILIAFAGKLLGAGGAALLGGHSRAAAAAIGVAMSARGAVELIVADVAASAGLFEAPSPPPPVVEQLFSSVVIVAVVTTVAAPVALKAVVGGAAADDPGFTDPSVLDDDSAVPEDGDGEGGALQEPSEERA